MTWRRTEGDRWRVNDEEELSEFLAEANVWRGTTEEDSNSSAVLSDIADTAAQSETRVALTPMTNTAECQNEIFINDKQALKALTLDWKLREDCSKARELQSKDDEEEKGLSRGFPVLSRQTGTAAEPSKLFPLSRKY